MSGAAAPIVRTGGCRCGRVRFTLRGEPFRVGFCHCESCRRATGGAFAVFVDVMSADVTIEGEPAVWSSRPGVERLFCPQCGSPVAYRDGDDPAQTALHLGAFDAPEELTPHHATFPDEGFAWALRTLAPLLREEDE